MRIHVLAFDGLFDTGLATVLDTLSTANELAAAGGEPRATPFEVTVIGLRRSVRTGQGLAVPVTPVGRGAPPDAVVIPALGAKQPGPLRNRLARPDILEAGALLREWSGRGTLACAACTGTFVLAGSALLEGKAATTTWWLAPLFRELYPRVALDESRMLVNSAHCVTAGAALAHLDLALWLVRRASPALAALTARYLVVDPRPSQAAFVIPDHLAHADPLVERFEHWARQRMARGFSLTDAARATGTSERTLARRLHAVLGKTPLSYFQELRVERAVHLLQTSRYSVEQIAAQVGYADGVTLRSLLRRKLGRGVRELRANAAGTAG
ncbi:GlxA family transcriptional regulator [Methylibium sp.]|jgi:transcriptional regulator GlxA family with amidase domain|uniref:GlxA family transcriptional regulator n=1 Tax=Methylibium sp. TaxID=2067992 RepID=UPI003D0BF45C